jgi:hypothetical protein
MRFLVIDGRFGTPIYAFLLADPRADKGYPGLAVREVSVEVAEAADGPTRRLSVGCDPRHPNEFREFRSEGAVARAGFVLVEPLYIGETWQEYENAYRPQGGKCPKRPHPRR